MINFLPPEEKAVILKKRKTKLVFVGFLLPLIFFLFLSMLLFPLEIFLSNQATYLEAEAAQNKVTLEKSSATKQKNEIEDFGDLMKNLKNFYGEKIFFYEVLEKFDNILPKEVYLTKVFISPKPDRNGFAVSVRGFSPTREKLIELKSNVEKENLFEKNSFPLGNWVKPDNIDFSFNFEVSPAKNKQQ
jgi:hypothetical protein